MDHSQKSHAPAGVGQLNTIHHVIGLYGEVDNQMTWSSSGGIENMYRGFLEYFEKINQQYRDYALNMQKINESYAESIRLIERINEVNKEFIDNYAKMNQLYKQHFEDMQKVNQQWLNLFWKPFMVEQQQQPGQEGQEKK